MVKHIVFHDDLDGIVAAALYLRYKINAKIGYRLHPVPSHFRGEKFKDFIASLNIQDDDELNIFDFENHGQSTFWVDHHLDKILGFQATINDEAIYDPQAYSASSLLFNHLKKTIELSHNVVGVVKNINIIDNAMYPDVNFIFSDSNPLMIMRAYLELERTNDMIYQRMVEVLAQTDFDLNETIAMLNLTTNSVLLLKDEAIKAKQFMEVYNKISLIRQKRIGQFPRYSENLIRPDVKYNIRISPIGNNKWHLQLCFNQFNMERNNVHIGKFLSNLDYVIRGGGHHNVGGGTLKDQHVDRFLDDLCLITNNYEDKPMEKYAVDMENDPVENKAQELVKTGHVVTIDEARQQVAQEENISDGLTQKA